MLKARGRSPDGQRIVFMFGLSAKNRQMLIAGSPIYFPGSEVAEPDAHFLICRADNAEQLHTQRKHYQDNDPRWLYSVGLGRRVLEHLHEQIATLEGLRGGTANILLFAGETEHEMGAMLGIHMQPVQSGFRDVFDPVTGAVKRVPEDKPS